MKFYYCIFILLSLNIYGASNKGEEIAQAMDKAHRGFQGSESEMELVLISQDGTKLSRKMKGLSIEGDKTDKSLLTFTFPPDVNGIKMLTWGHRSKEDDQWLFLPAIKRVKKISSKTKGSSFMGSEFSYEDLGSQAIEKYTYQLVKEDQLDGKKVWVLERVPKTKSSYSKTHLYVDQKNYIVLKTEYYNKRNELYKISYASDIKEYRVAGKVMYRVGRLKMENIKNKKSSLFIWSKRKLGVNISERKFHKNALKR